MQEIDELTIKAASRGDSGAFRRVYDHYAPFVWKVVLRTVNGDEEGARHVMQNTFIRVHASLKGFRFESAFSTWLYRIAFSDAIRWSRGNSRRNRRTAAFDEQQLSTGHTAAAAMEDRDMTRRILRNLEPRDRFLLVGREVEGLSFEELGRIMSSSSGALRTRLHRIKERIRRSFEDGTAEGKEILRSAG
jgi:RNA polymerase sigma-70 factor (ECF subfamily)